MIKERILNASSIKKVIQLKPKKSEKFLFIDISIFVYI